MPPSAPQTPSPPAAPPHDGLAADLPRIKRRLRPRLRRVAVRLAYDGAAFHGFQRQPGQRTVEGALMEALTAAGLGTSLAFASRTDRGVHALGQVVALRIPHDWSLDDLASRWCPLLPADLTVDAMAEAPAKFHPRWSAEGKRYRYTLARAEGPRRWAAGDLSTPRLTAAAGVLLGCSELRGFTAAGAPSRPAPGLTALQLVQPTGTDLTQLVFEGPAFQRYAIRHMTAALVACGRGDWAAEDLPSLAVRQTPWAGPRAPADGLVLEQLFYPAELDPFASRDNPLEDGGGGRRSTGTDQS